MITATNGIIQSGKGVGGGGGTTDPNFANTQLLLHADDNFTDSSTANRTVTNNGNVTFTTGVFEQAFNFSGSNYLSVADAASLRPGDQDFTIECFVNYTNLSGFQTIFDKGYAASGGIVIQTGNGTGRFIVYINGSAVCSETGSNSTGVNYFYQFIRSGSSVKIYRDSVETASGTSSVDLNSNSNLVIGMGSDATPANFLRGSVDECRYTVGVARNPGVPTVPFPNS